jgi:signal peptidase II
MPENTPRLSGNRLRDGYVKRNTLLISTVAGLVVLLDQITKYCITSRMELHESIPVVAGFFHITYVKNPGAAFGFLAGASPLFRSVFFLAMTAAAIALIIHYLRGSEEKEPALVFSLSLILGGAVGNLIDRLWLGEVIDFLDVSVSSYHWPAFNVADSAISIGAAVIFVAVIRRRETPSENVGRKKH